MKQEEKTKRTRERILEAICQRGCFTITSGVRMSFICTACGMYMIGRWNI